MNRRKPNNQKPPSPKYVQYAHAIDDRREKRLEEVERLRSFRPLVLLAMLLGLALLFLLVYAYQPEVIQRAAEPVSHLVERLPIPHDLHLPTVTVSIH